MEKIIKLKDTNRTERIWINGKIREFNVKLAKIDDLFLYPANTRLEILSKKEKLNSSDFRDEEIQNKLREIIRNEYPKENEETKISLIEQGLKDPIFIDKYGLVLSGNRRTTLMKEIHEEDNSKFSEIEVVVEEKELSDIEKKTYELMLQYEVQKKVDYSRLSRMSSAHKTFPILRDSGLDETQIAKRLSYPSKVSMLKDINEYEILEKYIEFYNKDVELEENKVNIWDFDKEKYLNVIDTINRLISKRDDVVEKEKIMKSIFSIMVLDTEQSLDIRSVFTNAYPGNNADREMDNYFKLNIEKIIDEKLSDSYLSSLKNKSISDDEIEKNRLFVKSRITTMSKMVKQEKNEAEKIINLDALIDEVDAQIDRISPGSLTTAKIKEARKIATRLKKIQKKLEKLL